MSIKLVPVHIKTNNNEASNDKNGIKQVGTSYFHGGLNNNVNNK